MTIIETASRIDHTAADIDRSQEAHGGTENRITWQRLWQSWKQSQKNRLNSNAEQASNRESPEAAKETVTHFHAHTEWLQQQLTSCKKPALGARARADFPGGFAKRSVIKQRPERNIASQQELHALKREGERRRRVPCK